jgi:hypothetical protein
VRPHRKQQARALLRAPHTVAILALGHATAACTGQTLYTTARTAPPNAITVLVAEELAVRPAVEVPPNRGLAYHRPPPYALPLVGVRAGLSESVDVGVQQSVVAASTSGDVKWNPLRSRYLDLALLARVTLAYPPRLDRPTNDVAGGGLLVHAPLLVGLNAGPIILTLSPGMTPYLDRYGRVSLAARAGLGVRAHVTQDFAIHPEVTWMDEVAGPSEMHMVTLGVGVVFGTLPDHRLPTTVPRP